jgi:hypothetical protein
VVTRVVGRASVCPSTFAVLILWFLASAQMCSQVVGGTLSGTITDASGAVIPSAQVSIKNVATGVTTLTTTNPNGIYNAPNLLPGTYDITIFSPGFQTEVLSGITLTVGAQQVLNLTMKVGAVTERVQVTGEAPAVQLASSTINGGVSSNTIAELPLNGRSWTDLATLQPGVSSIRDLADATTHDRLGRGLGNQMSIDGGRPQQNNYLLNGISINDYSNQAPGSILGGNLGADAVSEFTILTSNYSTEYGRSSGGVISAITRSGTNQFHGSAYEFLRNSALDARNFFDGSAIPAFRRNQFGASAGGPIRKDKTFIFGDYEGLRETKGLSTLDIVPSPAARGIGTGPGGTAGPAMVCSNPAGADPSSPCSTQTLAQYAAQNSLVIPRPDTTTGIDTSVLPYLKAFYPLPNAGLIGNGDTGLYSPAQSQTNTINYVTFRVDHRLSSSDSLAGGYMYDKSPFLQPDAFNNYFESNETRRQVVTLEENHLFSSTLVNTLRGGWSHIHAASPASATAINPAAASMDPTLAFIRGDSAGGVLDNSGSLTMVSGGLSSATPAFFNWNSYQVYDNLFLTKGIHSLKFGGNAERILYLESDCGNCGGNFTFGSLQGFLTNNPISIIADKAPSSKDVRETVIGAYVQDDIRFRPNLTINAGLRYEMATVPRDINGAIATLHSLDGSKMFAQSLASLAPRALPPGVAPVASAPFKNPSLWDFEPRLGFSWDPFHTGKTAIRGGFGMFDVQIFPVNLRGALGAYPFSIAFNSPNLLPGDFPSTAVSRISAPTDSTAQHGILVEQNPKRNYVMQWNLNIQREIASNTTFMIAYVGSRGVHNLFHTDDSDIVLPTTPVTPHGYLWPCGPDGSVNPDGSIPTCVAGFSPAGTSAHPIPTARINPNFGRISAVLWSSESTFHALEAQVTKRMSHGLEAQVSYTYGSSTDTSSGSTDGDQFLNGVTSLYFFDPRTRRGPSDFNVPNNLVASYNWDIPSPKGVSGVLGWASSGWEFGGIFQASNGTPFTPLIGGDPLGIGNTDPVDLPNLVPGCNPVHGGVNYLNLKCFSLPVATPDIAARCQPFGFVSSLAGPGAFSAGIAGTCANVTGNAGRNSVIGPTLTNFDMSLVKNTHVKRISETFNAQFRVEVFNILNHANFNAPTANNAIFDGTGVRQDSSAGLITRTATTSRQVQFALKLSW